MNKDQEEMKCPRCSNDMKEYVTRFRCRNQTCLFEYNKSSLDSTITTLSSVKSQILSDKEAMKIHGRDFFGYVRSIMLIDEMIERLNKK